MPKRAGVGNGPATKSVKTNVVAVWASKTFDQAKPLSIYSVVDLLNVTRINCELLIFYLKKVTNEYTIVGDIQILLGPSMLREANILFRCWWMIWHHSSTYPSKSGWSILSLIFLILDSSRCQPTVIFDAKFYIGPQNHMNISFNICVFLPIPRFNHYRRTRTIWWMFLSWPSIFYPRQTVCLCSMRG